MIKFIKEYRQPIWFMALGFIMLLLAYFIDSTLWLLNVGLEHLFLIGCGSFFLGYGYATFRTLLILAGYKKRGEPIYTDEELIELGYRKK